VAGAEDGQGGAGGEPGGAVLEHLHRRVGEDGADGEGERGLPRLHHAGEPRQPVHRQARQQEVLLR